MRLLPIPISRQQFTPSTSKRQWQVLARTEKCSSSCLLALEFRDHARHQCAGPSVLRRPAHVCAPPSHASTALGCPSAGGQLTTGGARTDFHRHPWASSQRPAPSALPRVSPHGKAQCSMRSVSHQFGGCGHPRGSRTLHLMHCCRQFRCRTERARQRPTANPSFEPTATGKPASAAQLKR